jgi:Uma2 family endonuclease
MAVTTTTRPEGQAQETQPAPRPLMPLHGEWTVEDLDRLPDDGLRYELLDGVLVVSPAPAPLHQIVVQALYRALEAESPLDQVIFVAPLDYRRDRTTSAQPDVMAVREEDIEEKHVTRPPLLVVEVLSPSGRGKDLQMKRALYERTGVPSFWVVDPDVPSLTAHELVDGAYVEVVAGAGAEPVSLRHPFPVTIVPADLWEVRSRRPS